MMKTFGPKTNSEAKAFIAAELDDIVENFEKSLRRCNKTTEILVMGTEREYKHRVRSLLEQTMCLASTANGRRSGSRSSSGLAGASSTTKATRCA